MTHPNQVIQGTSGSVYQIVCTVNSKAYVGRTTKRLSIRWSGHKSALRHNRHSNPRLQADWNEYGIEAFTIEALCECPKRELAKREKELIEELKPNYNQIHNGFKHTNESKALMRETAKERGIPPEQQAKMQEALRERFKVKPKARVTEATRKKMSLAHQGLHAVKLTVEKAREIKAALSRGVMQKDLASQYGVARSVISDIKRGILWRHA